MNIPDPRHAAATAPVATPPAPQWGGQAPSVIDPGMIAHLANAFLNATPGETVDPQALANFAAALERPPTPPTSGPGAVGAAAAAPGTSLPGVQSVPFVTELPSRPTQAARAPAQHIPAAALVTGVTGFPAGAASSPPPVEGFTSPAPEKGQSAPRGFLSEADLRALPQSLGPLVSNAPTSSPSAVSPASLSHGGPSGLGLSPAAQTDSLYFLSEAAAAQPGSAAPAPAIGLGNWFIPEPPSQSLAFGAPAAAPLSIEQSPSFPANFPSERELRPQGLSESGALGPALAPEGFSHASTPLATPAGAGESLYFLNEAQSAAAAGPAISSPAATPAPSAAVAPELSPLLEPGVLSGTRAFNAPSFKQDFPILRQHVHGKPLIWLDNAATTQKPQAVIDRLATFYETENSNIHRAAHALAARATDAYEAAREKVRRFLGAGSPNDIVFARGATEAINLVAKAWGRRNVREGDEIVVTWLEHHANIVPWQMLCAETGAVLRVAPVDDSGQILLDEYAKLLGPKTRLVSLTQVSNALGTVTPAQEMVAIAHRHGACVLVDGAQAVSHMPVDVQALDCDFYVFSGHKVFGPTGIGVLYGKPEVLEAMPPWQGGGNMIADVTFEKTIYQPPPGRFEAGTGNIGDAVGLGAAIDYVERIGMANIAAYEHELLAYATDGLLGVPGLTIIGTAKEKAGVISFVLDGCRSEDVGAALDREGIAVRSGHHCAQPILRRFGLETTVRPSLALYNTHEDIDALVTALHRIQTQKTYRSR
ncbi:family 2A encapsulin nanocompartment cargo protein cysteine desulfurase [Methylocapsa acidiphila]|uniref:family 2A encapsulin nanocompartment cargo protein cysteine desulfurase n=1 Tax=Methylocapsa acidiphila TaxID=133552 RepID=UPI00047ABF04|nr:family 2A encapsulin nanocompartment cargo protein cysteine desulfurase [Methylocapsa acidiphila]